MEDIKLEISEKTMKEMIEFFMKTSIPRILKEMKDVKQNDPVNLGKR